MMKNLVTVGLFLCFLIAGCDEQTTAEKDPLSAFSTSIEAVAKLKEPKIICERFGVVYLPEMKNSVYFFDFPSESVELEKLNDLQILLIRNTPIFPRKHEAEYTSNFVKWEHVSGTTKHIFNLNRTSLALSLSYDYVPRGESAAAYRASQTFLQFLRQGKNKFKCELKNEDQVLKYLTEERNRVKKVIDNKFKVYDENMKKRKL